MLLHELVHPLVRQSHQHCQVAYRPATGHLAQFNIVSEESRPLWAGRNRVPGRDASGTVHLPVEGERTCSQGTAQHPVIPAPAARAIGLGSRNVGASRRAPGSSLAGHRSWSKSLSSRQACAPVGGASSPSVPAGRGPSEDGVRETPRRLRVPRTSFRLGFPATGQLPLRRERGRQRAGRPTRRAALRDHRGRSSRSAC